MQFIIIFIMAEFATGFFLNFSEPFKL
jgi:hypothetical protein